MSDPSLYRHGGSSRMIGIMRRRFPEQDYRGVRSRQVPFGFERCERTIKRLAGNSDFGGYVLKLPFNRYASALFVARQRRYCNTRSWAERILRSSISVRSS